MAARPPPELLAGRPPPELDFLSPPDVFDVERALDITRSVTVPFADVRPLDNLAVCARLLPGAAARPARPPSAAARAAAIAAAAASGQKRPRSESPPAEGPPPAPRHRGTVRLWDFEKGYGFICPADGGQDLFCHRSAIEDGDALGEGFAVADAAHACLPKHARRSLTRRLAAHTRRWASSASSTRSEGRAPSAYGAASASGATRCSRMPRSHTSVSFWSSAQAGRASRAAVPALRLRGAALSSDETVALGGGGPAAGASKRTHSRAVGGQRRQRRQRWRRGKAQVALAAVGGEL